MRVNANVRVALALAVLAAGGVGAASLAGAAAPATPASAARPAAGELVYMRWCVHCHDAGRGNPGTQSLQVKYGGRLPALILERTDLTPEAVSAFVRQGV